MEARPVPVSLRGPNVAQVRPMVHTVPQPGGTGVLQTMASQTLKTDTAANNDSMKPPVLPIQPTPVPPGRYKYTTGSVAGHHGIYLVPVAQQPDSTEPTVFVPFSTKTTTVAPSLLAPQMAQNINILPHSTVASGASQGVILLQSKDSTQASVSTSQTPVIPAFTQLASSTTATNMVRPGTIIFKNVATSVSNSGQHRGAQPNVITHLMPPRQSSGTLSPVITPSPKLSVKAKETRHGDHNYNQTPLGPLQPVMHPKTDETKYGHVTPLQVQPLINSSVTPTTFGHNHFWATPEPQTHDIYPTLTGPSVPRLPHTVTVVANASNPTESSNVSVVTRPPTGGHVNPPKPVGTLLIPRLQKKLTGESEESPPVLLSQNEGTECKDSLDSSTDSADSSTEACIKQEPEDKDSSEESQGFTFKIDSVFSLSSAPFPDTESTQKQKGTKPKCPYNDTRFVALQKLDLKGLKSVDVRKFRKLTGRQSCNKKCRERAIDRLCRSKKLHLKEMEKSIPKFSQDSQIKLRAEELSDFEAFCGRCRPAPRSRKLKLFRSAEFKVKFNFAPNKRHNKSPGKIAGDRTQVAQEAKFVSPIVPESTNTTVSFSSPGKKPVGTSSGTITNVLTTATDQKSPTSENTNGTPATKKFYLIKVEGKNILIPLEQSKTQPRAYVLGDDTGESSVKAAAQNIVSGKFGAVRHPPEHKGAKRPLEASMTAASTQVNIKNEPVDFGYEKKQTKQHFSSVAEVRIKQEPMRGYADEHPTRKDNGTRTPTFTASHSANPSAAAKQITGGTCGAQIDKPAMGSSSTDGPESVNPSPIAPKKPVSSADRIRKLKELLKKNEEELEMIKKRRKEDAVDLSSVLDDDSD